MRIRYQFELIQAIRNFFNNEGFMDVLTPPMVENPGMETHLHPFEVHSVLNKKSTNKYLHTSPEFHMKELLSLSEEKLDKIFTLSYCFRDEPNSPIHRHQFIMLEWYRKNSFYTEIMDDIEALIAYCTETLAKKNIPLKNHITDFPRKTIAEIFKEILNINILDYLECDQIEKLIKQHFPSIHLPEQKLSWDDYYFLLFLNEVEPKLEKYPYLLLYEYPAPLSALSTIKKANPKVCERFEVYINGIELCNCFNELVDLDELKKRFSNEQKYKYENYGYQLNEPKEFYQIMQRGFPPSAGIALGVERLLLALIEIENPFFSPSNN